MADLSGLISLVKLLVTSSASAQTTSLDTCKHSPLVHSLRASLKVYKDTLSKASNISSHIEQIRQSYLLTEPSTDSDTLLTYTEFVRDSLYLLACLDNSLRSLDEQDKADQSGNPPHSNAPRALLSITDIRTVHTLLQFVVSLGIYPYLSPAIDCVLRVRLSNVNSLEKMTSLPEERRSLCLHNCVKVLTDLFGNPVLGASVLSKHLSDVLSALIQVCYGSRPSLDSSNTTSHGPIPIPKNTETLTTPGNIGQQSSQSDVVPDSGISAAQREWCVATLHQLLRQTYQPLVIRELLSLQGMAARRQGTTAKGGSWVRKACGQLLSERLMDKNGVENVLKGIHDSTGAMEGNNWKRYHAIAMVIASCPAQASSMEDYYSQVCPQVLTLLQTDSSTTYVKVATSVVSTMLSKHRDMTIKYLIHPLLEPLSRLCSDSDVSRSDGDSLVRCIDCLHKITCAMEPSSPLLSILLTYSPMLFHVWLASKDLKHVVPSDHAKAILCRVLKIATADLVLDFLCFVSQLPQPESLVHFKCFHPTVSISYTTDGTLLVENLTEQEVLERQSVQEMERVGDGVMGLLQSELKQEGLLGPFFLLCLKHLTTVISQQTGSTQKLDDKSSKTSSVLLECEQRLPPSQAEAYTSSLALYITASICEELSTTLLQQVSIEDLLSCLAVLLSCHASYGKGLDKVVLSKEGQSGVVGGPITLSVAFGLLSAILSGSVQVERKHRLLLTQLQPSLIAIATSYPDKELSSLAKELHVCIATLGAVWSTEAEQSAATLVTGAKQAVKENLTSQKQDDSKTSKVNHAQPDDSTDLPSVTSEQPAKLTSYRQAMQEVSDHLVPVRGHGLLALTRLIDTKDKEALTNSHSLLSLFEQCLEHDDSYIYLPAINGLVSLASIPQLCSSVIATLCQDYAQLDGYPTLNEASRIDKESGQLKTYTTAKSNSTLGAGGKRYSVEVRMKLGEALVKVSRACGEMLPRYLDQITAAIFSNVRDPDPLIRASSLSNLADVCAGVKFSFPKIQTEVIACVTSVLESEREVKVRQAALLVLKLIIKSLSGDTVQTLGEILRDVYRLLKSAEAGEQDELSKAHAQAALGELDTVMREYLFPQQSKELSKKISVLDLM